MEINPYQATPLPEANVGFPVRQTPISVMVFGVLNLVFGVLGVFSAIFAVISMRMQGVDRGQNPVLSIMDNSPIFRVYHGVAIGFSFVGAIVCLMSGIYLLRSKTLGRLLALAYGLLSLTQVIIALVMNTIFICLPILAKYHELPPGQSKLIATIVLVSIYVSCGIGVIHPSLLLFFMTRKKVVDALQ